MPSSRLRRRGAGRPWPAQSSAASSTCSALSTRARTADEREKVNPGWRRRRRCAWVSMRRSRSVSQRRAIWAASRSLAFYLGRPPFEAVVSFLGRLLAFFAFFLGLIGAPRRSGGGHDRTAFSNRDEHGQQVVSAQLARRDHLQPPGVGEALDVRGLDGECERGLVNGQPGRQRGRLEAQVARRALARLGRDHQVARTAETRVVLARTGPHELPAQAADVCRVAPGGDAASERAHGSVAHAAAASAASASSAERSKPSGGDRQNSRR